jgi:hypothetical protein
VRKRNNGPNNKIINNKIKIRQKEEGRKKEKKKR